MKPEKLTAYFIILSIIGCGSIKKEIRTINEKIEKIEFIISELGERVSLLEKETEDIADTASLRAQAQKDLVKEIYEIKKDINELREYVYSFQRTIPLKRKESAESLYRRAYDLYSSTKYNEAISLFGRILKKFPSHALADNALYWTGECYYKLGEVDKALSAFQKVIKRYPNGNKVADAKIKIAWIYHQRGKTEEALKLLDEVIKTSRDPDAVKRAINMRNEITKSQGGEE